MTNTPNAKALLGDPLDRAVCRRCGHPARLHSLSADDPSAPCNIPSWSVVWTALEDAMRSELARREAAELFKQILGWIVEDSPALVHGYVMGHHGLNPISDLPTFFRAFPSVDLTGWMAKHAETMAALAARAEEGKP